MKMKVLVTGGAGYIGSHTCKELAKQGHIPIVYDNLSTGHREFVKWGDFIHGDIKDTQYLRNCLQKFKPDGIIHFAAYAYVGESVINPGKYFDNNVAGTLSLLSAMRDENIKNIVVSSTCAVYGQPDEIPISENCPTYPINPYGRTKLIMEQMLNDFKVAHGINWSALRYFNAAGCDEDCEIGEWHDPETHLIPRVIMAALGKIDELQVFGNDYPTPDGTCIRDYVHVQDLATAHILALKFLVDGKESCAFNLGTGFGFSVQEIINGLEKIIDKKIPFSVVKRRAGDPAKLIANPVKSNDILGWKCKKSGLENILQTALNWSVKTGY